MIAIRDKCHTSRKHENTPDQDTQKPLCTPSPPREIEDIQGRWGHIWGLAYPAKHDDCEERRGTADDEQLPQETLKRLWRFECKRHEP